MFLKDQSTEYNNSAQGLETKAQNNQVYENVSAIDLGLTSQIDYPILNFFGGSVRTDRVEHENVSRRAGLARWNRNSRDASSYTQQVEHAGFTPARSLSNQAQRSTAGYGTSAQSPGMGLECENLQSFISGAQHTVIPIASARPEAQIGSQQQESNYSPMEGSLGHTELPSGAPAPAKVYKFRRMKTTTFHNLLAMAMNE
ncbi:hypothetical protein KBI23_20680 [bacterium]|nr:hypothetical protein [bacterium]MBP9809922.1 hypothetical protein [bacterium]